MLLVCPRCQNTYTLDDQIYAQQGALCQTCMEPLVPMQDNGYDQGAQWGNQPQYGSDAQWGNQPQYGNDAQWGNQPQYGNDAQWGNQPQYGNDAQWGNQPQYGSDAQWGNQPLNGNDAQWGNQPVNGQWGQQAQWNQGGQANGGYDPMPTLGLDEQAIGSMSSETPVNYSDSNERTVALEIGVPAPAAQESMMADDDGWGDAWGGEGAVPSKKEVPAAPPVSRQVIGSPMVNMGNDQKTRQIDAKMVQKMYGDRLNPVSEFFKSLPNSAIVSSIVMILLVFGGCGYVVYENVLRPEKIERDITADGDIVIAGTAAKPETFKEIAAKTKAAIPSIKPFDGQPIDAGIVIGISDDTGVIYNNKKITSLDTLETSSAFVKELYEAAAADHDTPIEQPIVLFFDETLPMSVAYRALYSLGPTRRKVLIGGTTATGVTAIEFNPSDWPDHEGFIYGAEPPANTQIKITREDILMRRTSANNEALLIDEDGNEHFDLRDHILGGKIVLQNINGGLAKLRAVKHPSILLTTDGDVTVGTFLTIALQVYGDINTPNVKKLLLDQVPLR